MKTETRKSRAVAFIMVLLLSMTFLIALNPNLLPTAYAAQATTSPSSGNGDVWDIVGSDGKVDENNQIIDSNTNNSAATVISKYKTIATAISGILTITMLVFLLIQISKLGAAGDNEIARKKAIMGILTTGLATALFGGVTIVVGFFWNILK